MLKLNRSSTAVAVLRLSSLVAIPVTGLVFHAVLARRWTSRPGMRSARRLALADPPHLLARLTLIRGAIAHWYPYPFIDVTQLGYAAPPSTACGWLCCLVRRRAQLELDRRLTRAPGGTPGVGERHGGIAEGCLILSTSATHASPRATKALPSKSMRFMR